MIATPLERRSFMIVNRWSTSSEVSEEVGSSMMITFALKETAFAISIDWICDTESVLTSAFGSRWRLSRSSRSRVSLYIFL